MFERFRQWRHKRIVEKANIPDEAWADQISRLRLLKRLSEDELNRLKILATLLLHRKDFSAAHDLSLTEPMKRMIALQACLPILNLGLGWYKGWHSIIVYPQGFFSEQDYVDEFGVTHQHKRALSGEAWDRGPVILSWDDVEHAGEIDGDNLVIHEFAHKLDMRNGLANGFPPLHKGMDSAHWAKVFSNAFQHFRHSLEHSRPSNIDPYAAHSPAEFFSVLSEVFFERPEIIYREYPDVYRLLSEFYRQDTLASFK